MRYDFINYGKHRVSNPQVVLTESTEKILEEENIVIEEKDTAEEVVEKVKKSKSKKVVAKVEKNGKASIKQSLNG